MSTENTSTKNKLSDFIPEGEYTIYYSRKYWDGELVGSDILNTHIKLGSIDAQDLNDVFQIMNTWGQGAVTNEFLGNLGVNHTSMSVGDIIEIRGIYFMVDYNGFYPMDLDYSIIQTGSKVLMYKMVYDLPYTVYTIKSIWEDGETEMCTLEEVEGEFELNVFEGENKVMGEVKLNK